MSALARLTVAEADVLADCEETISHGLQTFVEVGTALGMIRDNKLYRATHGTFEAYCTERWGFTDRRARQIIEAAEIGNMFPVENSRQAGALARVPEAERADVWRAANDATDGKPTAAAIRAAANPDSPSGPIAPSASATDEDRTGPTTAAGAQFGAPADGADDSGTALESHPVTGESPAVDGAAPARPGPVEGSPGPGRVTPEPDVPQVPPEIQRVRDFVNADPRVQITAWRSQFMKAIGAGYQVFSFDAAVVAEKADQDLIDELHRLATELAGYASRVDAKRPKGLRVLPGGAA